MKKLTLSILVTGLALSCFANKNQINWVQNPANNHYYAVIEAQNWEAANQTARRNGAHLVTLSSISESNFIRTTFSRSEKFWIGLDINKFNQRSFRWVTDEPLSFLYFGANSPVPISLNYRGVINELNSRGFTRGYFGQYRLNNKFRAIIERD